MIFANVIILLEHFHHAMFLMRHGYACEHVSAARHAFHWACISARL